MDEVPRYGKTMMSSGISYIIKSSLALMRCQFFRFCSTASGLYEMCSAGGGEAKLYRPRFPFDPDEVVWCCGKSFICNDLSFALVNYATVADPVFPVPNEIVRSNLFDGYFTVVCEHKLPFGDTGKLGNFALLPKMRVDAVLFYWYTEHLTGALAIDVSAVIKQIDSPLLPGEERQHPRLNS